MFDCADSLELFLEVRFDWCFELASESLRPSVFKDTPSTFKRSVPNTASVANSALHLFPALSDRVVPSDIWIRQRSDRTWVIIPSTKPRIAPTR